MVLLLNTQQAQQSSGFAATDVGAVDDGCEVGCSPIVPDVS